MIEKCRHFNYHANILCDPRRYGIPISPVLQLTYHCYNAFLFSLLRVLSLRIQGPFNFTSFKISNAFFTELCTRFRYFIEDILVLVYLLGTPELVGGKEEVIFMYKYEL